MLDSVNFIIPLRLHDMLKAFMIQFSRKLWKPQNNRELDLYKIDNQHYPIGYDKC